MNVEEQNDLVQRVMDAIEPALELSDTGFVTLVKPYNTGAEDGGTVLIAVKCGSKRQLQAMFRAMFESPITSHLGAIHQGTRPPVRVFDEGGRECFWSKRGAVA